MKDITNEHMKEETASEVKDKVNGRSMPNFRLSQLYFYLTAGCNLACRHCWLNPKLQKENKKYPVLPLELFKSILEQAKPLGLSAVKLTGGEPLMHPDILEILRIIRVNRLFLSLETNGVLCNHRLAGEIAAIQKCSVSVSLDGIDAETHEAVRGIKGCFDAAVEGIENLVNAGLQPQLIMTIMQRNKHQVESLVRLAERLGAGSIKFGFVNPTGRGESLDTGGETLSIEELLVLGKWVTGPLARSTNVKIYYSLPAAFRSLSELYGREGDGCRSCAFRNMLGVLASGEYAFCGIGTHVPEMIFGDAATDRLADVWENNSVLSELRGDVYSRFEGICGNCHMKRQCSAYCLAQNYYRTGSLWKPYWFCEEAYKKGLFPASRITAKPFR